MLFGIQYFNESMVHKISDGVRCLLKRATHLLALDLMLGGHIQIAGNLLVRGELDYLYFIPN